MFVILTGVETEGEYLITDPCLTSNESEEKLNEDDKLRLCSADCGKPKLLQWFENHKCGKYCNKGWKHPNEKPSVNTKAVKSTSYASHVSKLQGGGVHSLTKQVHNMTLSPISE